MGEGWTLTIELTEEERAAFASQAAVEGVSLEEWLRQAAHARLSHLWREPAEERPKSLLDRFESLGEV